MQAVNKCSAYVEGCLAQIEKAKHEGTLDSLNTSQLPRTLLGHLKNALDYMQRVRSDDDFDITFFTITIFNLCKLGQVTEITQLSDAVIKFLAKLLERVHDSKLCFENLSVANEVSTLCRTLMNLETPPGSLSAFLLELSCLLKSQPALIPLYYNVEDVHLADFPVLNATLVLVDRYGAFVSHISDKYKDGEGGEGDSGRSSSSSMEEPTAKPAKNRRQGFLGLIANVTSQLSAFGQGSAPPTTPNQRNLVSRKSKQHKIRLALINLLTLPNEDVAEFIVAKPVLIDLAAALSRAYEDSLAFLVSTVNEKRGIESSYVDGVFNYSNLSLNYTALDTVVNITETLLSSSHQLVKDKLRESLFNKFFAGAITVNATSLSDDEAVPCLVVTRVMLLRGASLELEGVFGEFLRCVSPISEQAKTSSLSFQAKVMGMIESPAAEVALEALLLINTLLSPTSPHLVAHFVLYYLANLKKKGVERSENTVEEEIERIMPASLKQIYKSVEAETVGSASSSSLFSAEWRSLWEETIDVDNDLSLSSLLLSPSTTIAVNQKKRQGGSSRDLTVPVATNSGGPASDRESSSEHSGSGAKSGDNGNPSTPSKSGLGMGGIVDAAVAKMSGDFLKSFVNSFSDYFSRSPAVTMLEANVMAKLASLPYSSIDYFFTSQDDEEPGPLVYIEEILDSAQQRIEHDPSLLDELDMKVKNGEIKKSVLGQRAPAKEECERLYFLKNLYTMLSMLKTITTVRSVSEHLSQLYPPLSEEELTPSKHQPFSPFSSSSRLRSPMLSTREDGEAGRDRKGLLEEEYDIAVEED
mmetsp:Transcript_39159/g.100315  ORF Transcript_39159/g.100315 Transcript_39159/m.100315 type:complete len:811 (-) Transcript_39159:200-2632(-)